MRVFSLLCAAFVMALPFDAAMAELFVPQTKEQPQGTAEAESPSPAPKAKAPKQAPQVFVPTNKKKTLDDTQLNAVILNHTQEIGAFCVGAWQTQKCMQVLSSSNLTLASTYAEELESRGKKAAQDPLLENCAASTAALETEVPAYAMKSAMTTCANAISDINDATKIPPNLTHFQLLVEPIFCLGGEQRCAKFEALLREVVMKSLQQQQQPQ